MIKKLIAFSFLVFLFNSCCNKAVCNYNEAQLPIISVNFTNIPQTNDGVKVYTLYKNEVIDSLVNNYYYSYGYGITFSPYRFLNDPTVADKKFVIYHNSKADTITDVTCEFYSEKRNCGSCWPSGTQYSTLWMSRDFSFKHKGKKYGQHEALTLEF